MQRVAFRPGRVCAVIAPCLASNHLPSPTSLTAVWDRSDAPQRLLAAATRAADVTRDLIGTADRLDPALRFATSPTLPMSIALCLLLLLLVRPMRAVFHLMSVALRAARSGLVLGVPAIAGVLTAVGVQTLQEGGTVANLAIIGTVVTIGLAIFLAVHVDRALSAARAPLRRPSRIGHPRSRRKRMGIGEFQAKWRAATLKESSAAQEHFIDVCRMLGVPTPVEADPHGTYYCFERGARKTDGGDGWADVWLRGHFAWEYKAKHANLADAYRQLLLYREDLENPPVLVVCDLDRFEVHTNFTGTPKQVFAFTVADLDQPETLAILRAVFTRPEALRPNVTPPRALAIARD